MLKLLNFLNLSIISNLEIFCTFFRKNSVFTMRNTSGWLYPVARIYKSKFIFLNSQFSIPCAMYFCRLKKIYNLSSRRKLKKTSRSWRLQEQEKKKTWNDIQKQYLRYEALREMNVFNEEQIENEESFKQSILIHWYIDTLILITY